jgi:uncharacterized protein
MNSLVYDLIIFGFLIFDLLVIGGFIFGWIHVGKGSVNRVSVSVFIFMLISGGIVFYGSFIEPQKLVVTEYTWEEVAPEIAEVMSDVKVALISDLHIGPYKKQEWVAKVVGQLQEIRPNMVVLAGDLIFESHELTDEFEPFSHLPQSLGIYAVRGNHDYSSVLEEIPTDEALAHVTKNEKALAKGHIKPLVNDVIEFPDFTLGGIDDLWTSRANIAKTFENSPEGKVRILVSHNPDAVLYAEDHGVDLVLAGHTHAGQIRLPVWGSVPRLPTHLGNKFDEGIFSFEQSDGKRMSLVITRGAGESGPRARLFAPPEIVVIQ